MPRFNINDLLEILLNDHPLPPPEEYIAPTGRVDVIAGSKELYRKETALRAEMGTEHFLASILIPIRSHYFQLVTICHQLIALFL